MSPSEQGRAAAETVTLIGGSTATLVPRDGGWSLEIDGVRQSHIDPPGAPPSLTSVRWMLIALGGGTPLRCAHLGGGVLSLARAVAHARPGSDQVVVELEPELARLANDRFGTPDGVSIVVDDARRWIETQPPACIDAVLVDVFTGGRIPPAFTSAELFAAAHRSLVRGGRLIVNSVAGPELEFTRRELASLRAEFAHVGMIVQGSALHGARFGNATLVASDLPLEVERIRSELAEDPSRGRLLTDLDEIVGDATPVTDADALWSPEPRMPEIDAALRMIETLRTAVDELRSAAGAPKASDPTDRTEP